MYFSEGFFGLTNSLVASSIIYIVNLEMFKDAKFFSVICIHICIWNIFSFVFNFGGNWELISMITTNYWKCMQSKSNFFTKCPKTICAIPLFYTSLTPAIHFWHYILDWRTRSSLIITLNVIYRLYNSTELWRGHSYYTHSLYFLSKLLKSYVIVLFCTRLITWIHFWQYYCD